MPYKFIKPNITNVWRGTKDAVTISWPFWVFIVMAILFETTTFLLSGTLDPQVIFIILTILVIYVIRVQRKVRASFWKAFAEINGWKYKNIKQAGMFSLSYGEPDKEAGVMFNEGGARSITNEIEGVIEDRPFRLFCYEFSIGSGKNKKIYYYTVFAFKFNGSFPHVYLNNKGNSWSVGTGEKIPLPTEFEKKFSLSAPKEYEMEALEIFTPDILTSLLDGGFPYDVEFVNQEMLIFVDGRINSFEQLEKEFNKALELEDLMDEKLDKFKFQQIGDRPATLE